VVGEPNEGLVAQLLNTPARLAEYDDSKWEVCDNIRQSISKGFTFAWYRIAVVLPAEIDGIQLTNCRVYFEVNDRVGTGGFTTEAMAATFQPHPIEFYDATRTGPVLWTEPV